MAFGLGLGALVAICFAALFGFLVLRLSRRGEYYDDEYYDDEYELESEQEGADRAAEISRSWQQHGSAPPPAPGGAQQQLSSAAGTAQVPAPPELPSEPMTIHEPSPYSAAADEMSSSDAFNLLDSLSVSLDASIEEAEDEAESKELEESEDEPEEDAEVTESETEAEESVEESEEEDDWSADW